MRKIFFIGFCLVVFIGGCLSRHYKKQIINNYYLYAYASDEDMLIMHFDKYGGLEVVGSTVFAVGFNQNFIIAKQHPAVYPEKENRNITNYFIVPIKKPVTWPNEDVAIGPLNENEFAEKKKELSIPDTLGFSTVFNNIK